MEAARALAASGAKSVMATADGNGRRRRQMVSTGTGGGVGDGGNMGDSRRQERGESEAVRAAEWGLLVFG